METLEEFKAMLDAVPDEEWQALAAQIELNENQYLDSTIKEISLVYDFKLEKIEEPRPHWLVTSEDGHFRYNNEEEWEVFWIKLKAYFMLLSTLPEPPTFRKIEKTDTLIKLGWFLKYKQDYTNGDSWFFYATDTEISNVRAEGYSNNPPEWATQIWQCGK